MFFLTVKVDQEVPSRKPASEIRGLLRLQSFMRETVRIWSPTLRCAGIMPRKGLPRSRGYGGGGGGGGGGDVGPDLKASPLHPDPT